MGVFLWLILPPIPPINEVDAPFPFVFFNLNKHNGMVMKRGLFKLKKQKMNEERERNGGFSCNVMERM